MVVNYFAELIWKKVFFVSKNAREMNSEIPDSTASTSFYRCLKDLKIHGLFVAVVFDTLHFFVI